MEQNHEKNGKTYLPHSYTSHPKRFQTLNRYLLLLAQKGLILAFERKIREEEQQRNQEDRKQHTTRGKQPPIILNNIKLFKIKKRHQKKEINYLCSVNSKDVKKDFKYIIQNE